jgi:leucyl/phenylalanyl-tRNA--protein transferase
MVVNRKEGTAGFFPYLNENVYFDFPPLESATKDGIVAAGGNLSPGMLLSAYKQGIFPWYSDSQPILWWSPNPRFVIFPKQIHVSRTMKKVLKKRCFTYTLDTGFKDVINACRKTPRPNQAGTWITKEMLEAYCRLHELGYAHSVEVWQKERLVGGLYGVSLGSCFFGESMFSDVPNTSKAALIVLTWLITDYHFNLIDCQVYTPHLKSMGAVKIERTEFISRLRKCLSFKTYKGNWGRIFKDFPQSKGYLSILNS